MIGMLNFSYFKCVGAQNCYKLCNFFKISIFTNKQICLIKASHILSSVNGNARWLLKAVASKPVPIPTFAIFAGKNNLFRLFRQAILLIGISTTSVLDIQRKINGLLVLWKPMKTKFCLLLTTIWSSKQFNFPCRISTKIVAILSNSLNK